MKCNPRYGEMCPFWGPWTSGGGWGRCWIGEQHPDKYSDQGCTRSRKFVMKRLAEDAGAHD